MGTLSNNIKMGFMKIFKIIIGFLFLNLLAACATSQKDIAEKQIEGVPENNRAYIIGKFSVDCKVHGDDCSQAFNSISVDYKSTIDAEIKGGFGSVQGLLFEKDPKPDFVDLNNGEKGGYFCKPMKASDYEFYTYRFYNFAGGGSGYSIRKEDEFHLPFKLHEGDVLNIGDLKISTTEGRNIFGMRIQGPGVLFLRKLNNENKRNAMAKCPESIRNNLLIDASLEKYTAGTKGMVRSISQ